MTYEMYRYIFLGAAIACGVMVLVSAILFFTLKIPKVIGDLSGRNAKKAIENIRKQNEATGDKKYQSSAVNLERGKLTDKISQSGRVVSRNDAPFGTGVITEKISTQQLPPEEPAGETVLLQNIETTLLQNNETTLLQSNETTVLSPEMGQTENLQAAQPQIQPPAVVQNVFEIEFQITYIHTDEQIV